MKKLDKYAKINVELIKKGVVVMNKTIKIILLISIVMLLSLAFMTPHIFATTTIYGDVSEDGFVGCKDAMLVLQYSTGKRELTDKQLKIADVNGDGKVTTKDANLILQRAIGKISKFPIE